MKFDRDKTKPESRDDPESSDLNAARPLFARPQVERISAHVRRRLMPRSLPARSNIAFRARASRLFARELAVRRRRVQGADSSGFVSSHFGERFGSVQGRGFTDEKIYKEPGRFFRSTSLKSVTQFFMSFNVSEFAQNLRIFLNRIRSQQSFNSSEYLSVDKRINSPAAIRAEIRRTALLPRLLPSLLSQQHSPLAQWPPTARSLSEVRLNLAVPMGATGVTQLERRTFERQEIEHPQIERQRFERQRFERQRFERQRFERQIIDHVFTLTRSSGKKLSSSKTHLAHWTTLKQKVTDVLNRTFLNVIPVRNPERVLPQREVDLREVSPNVAWRRPVSAPSVISQLLLISRFGRQREKSESLHPWKRDSSAHSLLAFAKRFSFHRAEQVVKTSRFDRDSSVFSTGASLFSDRTLLLRQSMLGTVMNQSRSLVERSLRETKLFGTKLLKQFMVPYRRVEEVRSPQVTSELSLVRRDSVPELPPGFVFAQSARHEVSEERVVKRVETREILEMVKKEVKQSLTNVMSLSNFSRQDYEEISDRVYSSLVRRLTIERERLGLR